MDDLRRILINAGIPNVQDRRVAPHSTNFHPVGIILHHTAMDSPGLVTIQKGRGKPGEPNYLGGPLANINVARGGALNVVTDGLAYHAGRGSGVVLNRVKKDQPVGLPGKDDTDGNPWFIGFEIDNNGIGEKYPDVQILQVAKACAAYCDFYHWVPNRVIRHKDWTSRKPDWSYRGNIHSMIDKFMVT